MIKVLQTAPLRLGGITELILNVAENMHSEEVKFDYLCFMDTFENSRNRAIACGSQINMIDLTKEKKAVLRGCIKFLRIWKCVRQNKYKVIHINTSTPYEVLVAIAAKLGGAQKIILHSHNSSYFPGQKLTRMTEFFKRLMPLVVTDYLACSDAAAEFLFPKQIVKNKEYTVIRNGVNLQKLTFDSAIRDEYRQKYGLSANFVIGHIGRFNVQKNHILLIDIFKEVYSRDPSARLFLVGIGETESEVKEKVQRLGLQDVVVFHGLSNQVNHLMQMMDVFVLPSLYEGLPVAGVESQAAGLPMVVSDTITQELKLIDEVKYVALDASVSEWADQILRYKDYQRCDTSEYVTKAGYNILDTAAQLVRLYQAD